MNSAVNHMKMLDSTRSIQRLGMTDMLFVRISMSDNRFCYSIPDTSFFQVNYDLVGLDLLQCQRFLEMVLLKSQEKETILLQSMDSVSKHIFLHQHFSIEVSFRLPSDVK